MTPQAPSTMVLGVVASHSLEIHTGGRGFTDVTPEIGRLVAQSGVRHGLCAVFVLHTSASLVIQENADPAVLHDLQRFMDWVAAEKPPFGAWKHDDEGPDDMPAHVRSALTRTSELLPIESGRLILGTWQALYLWEHRRAPHLRKLRLTIFGE